MGELRRHHRISNTLDLLASVRASGHDRIDGRVLNLSGGGMLVAGTGLRIGDVAGFELHGPTFHWAGVARVAHTVDGATGLRFVSWQGQANRALRQLVDKRSGRGPSGSSSPRRRDQHIVNRPAPKAPATAPY